ncbi:MAG: hypothetical protein M1840_002990 [Geoglossum simile]|nr:MAG: hypothetical protein M1840_002990 [Geoglossum simile]
MTEQTSGSLPQDAHAQPTPEPVLQSARDEIKGIPDVNGKGYTQVEVEKVEKKINPDNALHAIEPKEGYNKLDFKPIILRAPFLFATIFFFLASTASLITLLHLTKTRGSIRYSSNIAHFATRYIPTVVGTITTIMWRAIATTLGRMTPYISLAANRNPGREHHSRGYRTVTADCMAPVRYFTAFEFASRHWLYSTVAFSVYFPLAFVTSLKSTFLIVVPHGESGWDIRVSQPVTAVLIAIYLYFAVLTCIMVIRLWNRPTGLKWDPVSIADQVALFHGSNVLNDFNGLELGSWSAVRDALSERTYRLGYWEKGADRKVWYGIGRESNGEEDDDLPHTRDVPDYYHPYRVTFIQLTLPVMVFWALLLLFGIIGCIYGLASKRIQRGIILGNTITVIGYRINMSQGTATFLFRGLPTFLSQVYTAFLWYSADRFCRMSQAFDGMYKEAQPASENILLGYQSDLPFVVSIKAAMNSHWRIAHLSAMSLLANILPVLVGAVFTVTPGTENITIRTSIIVFYAVFAFLCLYFISIPIAWPPRRRRLPRTIYTIADIISFCYASELVMDPAFDLQRKEDTREHMECKLFLEEHKYLFGKYLGTDGKRHLGFSISKKVEGEGQSVEWIDPKQTIRRRKMVSDVEAGE